MMLFPTFSTMPDLDLEPPGENDASVCMSSVVAPEAVYRMPQSTVPLRYLHKPVHKRCASLGLVQAVTPMVEQISGLDLNPSHIRQF